MTLVQLFYCPTSYNSRNKILLYRTLYIMFKDEVNDGGSDREDQRWNNSSDDDDNGGGTGYSWQGVNEKEKSTKKTKGKPK